MFRCYYIVIVYLRDQTRQQYVCSDHVCSGTMDQRFYDSYCLLFNGQYASPIGINTFPFFIFFARMFIRDLFLLCSVLERVRGHIILCQRYRGGYLDACLYHCVCIGHTQAWHGTTIIVYICCNELHGNFLHCHLLQYLHAE